MNTYHELPVCGVANQMIGDIVRAMHDLYHQLGINAQLVKNADADAKNHLSGASNDEAIVLHRLHDTHRYQLDAIKQARTAIDDMQMELQKMGRSMGMK